MRRKMLPKIFKRYLVCLYCTPPLESRSVNLISGQTVMQGRTESAQLWPTLLLLCPPTHVPLFWGAWALLPGVIKWLLQGRVATLLFTSASARAKSSNHYPPVARSQQEKKKAASRTCTRGHFSHPMSIKSARKRVQCVSFGAKAHYRNLEAKLVYTNWQLR